MLALGILEKGDRVSHYPRKLGILPEEKSQGRGTCFLNARTTQDSFGHWFMNVQTCIQGAGSQFKLVFLEAFSLTVSLFPNPVLTCSGWCLPNNFSVREL